MLRVLIQALYYRQKSKSVHKWPNKTTRRAVLSSITEPYKQNLQISLYCNHKPKKSLSFRWNQYKKCPNPLSLSFWTNFSHNTFRSNKSSAWSRSTAVKSRSSKKNRKSPNCQALWSLRTALPSISTSWSPSSSTKTDNKCSNHYSFSTPPHTKSATASNLQSISCSNLQIKMMMIFIGTSLRMKGFLHVWRNIGSGMWL